MRFSQRALRARCARFIYYLINYLITNKTKAPPRGRLRKINTFLDLSSFSWICSCSFELVILSLDYSWWPWICHCFIGFVLVALDLSWGGWLKGGWVKPRWVERKWVGRCNAFRRIRFASDTHDPCKAGAPKPIIFLHANARAYFPWPFLP